MNPVTDGPQQLMRLWGEEEQDGALYTVYLKKVRYHPRTTPLGEAVAHLEWETVRVKIIKAGTLGKLVESLATDTGELESTYINIFFSTYRSFATPSQVLTLLLDRYSQMYEHRIEMDNDNKESHKITFGKVLLVWLDIFPEDFFEPPQFLLLHQLLEFTKQYLPGSILELKANQKLEKFKNHGLEEPLGNFELLPSFNTILNSPTDLHLNFLDVPEKHIAQQLTYRDAELFKRLIPHHCLGSIWSQREKAKVWNISPFTVTATIDQFNAVSLRVISTILSDPSLKPFVRAKIVLKWINIAQELRFLKNFSSLKAITAALQSNPVYRLKKVWLMVSGDKVEAFTELARIFSEDNNQINCRNLLIKEGSAKFANTTGNNDKQLQKALHKQLLENGSTMQGTVPYLGTFLTDLTMIDTAIPDVLSNGLINFDKRRKEFEVLAQIKLLQSSSNNYDILLDKQFEAWFYSIPILDDTESYELSCLIEPLESSTSDKKHILQKFKSSVPKWGHKKNDSTSSTSTSSSNSQFYDQISNDSTSSFHSDHTGTERLSKSCSSLSLPFLCSSSKSSNNVRPISQEFYVIKVSLEQNYKDAKGVNLYKSIILSNRDHTRTVISNAMAKHGITGDPDDYTLAQLVPGGEIIFPSSANVFYAVNTAYDLNFILRFHRDGDDSIAKRNKPQFVKQLLNPAT